MAPCYSRAMVSNPTFAALEARLLRQLSRLGREHALFEPGDRIMVACSGGKDSWALLHLLRAHQRVLPFPISLVAFNLDQGHPGYDPAPLVQHLVTHGFEHHVEHRDTYSVVVANTPAGKTFCSRCSRMRRALLHQMADRLGANKIALGHHRDDLVETLWLNQLYAGRLRAMAAKLPAPPGGHAVIRPLLHCAETDLAAYAAAVGAPILPCNLCGSQPDARRQQVKRWLAELETQVPGLRASLLAAAGNLEPDHLLDRRFAGQSAGAAQAEPVSNEHTEDAEPLVRLRSMHTAPAAR
jgi:tRNA 2-thiocytidine biosynthesis protein TtcA